MSAVNMTVLPLVLVIAIGLFAGVVMATCARIANSKVISVLATITIVIASLLVVYGVLAILGVRWITGGG
jgi:hypothetical protein